MCCTCAFVLSSCQIILCSEAVLDLVSEVSHAGLVLVDKGHAVGSRVFGVGEEHALVALRLFFLADTAGLDNTVNIICISYHEDRVCEPWGARRCRRLWKWPERQLRIVSESVQRRRFGGARRRTDGSNLGVHCELTRKQAERMELAEGLRCLV